MKPLARDRRQVRPGQERTLQDDDLSSYPGSSRPCGRADPFLAPAAPVRESLPSKDRRQQAALVQLGGGRTAGGECRVRCSPSLSPPGRLPSHRSEAYVTRVWSNGAGVRACPAPTAPYSVWSCRGSRPAVRWLFHWGGRVGGNITGGDIGGGLAVYRLCGRGGGPVPEQVPDAALAAVVFAVVVVFAGRVVAQRAGGVGAGGVALADQVVAVLADGGGLAAGLPQAVAGLAAAAGGAGRGGQQEGQAARGEGPHTRGRA